MKNTRCALTAAGSMKFFSVAIIGAALALGACAAETEPEQEPQDDNLTSQKLQKVGIDGTAQSKSNTCSIVQGGMLNNKLTVKCTQTGGGICNGTMSIDLSEGIAQKGREVQTYKPSVSISKNSGWKAADGVQCKDGESITLIVKTKGDLVTSISLNGSAYTFTSR